MNITPTLKEAVFLYKNGQKSAFDTIYTESSKYIYVCIYNVLNGNDNMEDMIQDVMQDTYVEISRHLNSLGNVESFLSWAGTIATRKCYEIIKKNDRYVYLGADESFDNLEDDDNIIPEEVVQNKEKQRLLREIIQNELTEAQRLCIVGVYYNEMKQSEIAKELGIPENTVKSNLLRAKAKIKKAVVELAEKKNTKLYSVAPFLLLLFADEIKACVVPQVVTEGVTAAVGTTMVSVGTGATNSATGTVAAGTSATVQAVGTVVRLGIKAKIAIIATSVIVGIGAVAGGVAFVNNSNQDGSPEVSGETQMEIQIETQKEQDAKEQTTTQNQTVATEIWNKTVYEEAAIETLKNSYSEYIGFMDLDNDGIPELLSNTFYNYESSIYVYENGKYILSKSTKTFCPWDSKIYMDESGNILIFGVDNDGLGNFTEDGINYYQYYKFNLINMTTGDNRFLGSIFSEKYEKNYQNCTPYKCHVQPEKTIIHTPGYNGGGYSGPGENEVSKTEFDRFMADVVKDYTFMKNADEIYVSGTTEESVKEAYEIYCDLGL